jgi:hypothetical protein
LANSLSVPRGGNAFHAAKQRHQIRNMNVFERTHGIFDLVARPLVGVDFWRKYLSAHRFFGETPPLSLNDY